MPTYNEYRQSGRVFTRVQINELLNAARGKTLKDVDVKDIISQEDAASPNKVVTGVAGDVVELSVLGCNGRDSTQAPDIIVDGDKYELKTTGLKTPPNRGKRKDKEFQAKEPLTITAVSKDKIVNETFETSHFFEKIKKILFVYYHFLLPTSAKKTIDYCAFPIVGHHFWDIPLIDKEKLKNDWQIVHDFYVEVKNGTKTENDFSPLKKKLILINTNSHQSRRFRLKAEYLNTIVDTFLNQKKMIRLPESIKSIDDVYAKCRYFTEQYKDKTLGTIAKDLGVTLNGKDSCQQLIIKMFGSDAHTLSKVSDFYEMGLVAKTIILNHKGKRTEDMKLFKLDFDDLCKKDVTFRDEYAPENLFADISKEYSSFYSYFAEQSFLMIIAQEPREARTWYETNAEGKRVRKVEKIPLSDTVFVGFKHYSFDENWIMDNVQKTWKKTRSLIFNKTLKEERGARGVAPNFPKSKNYLVFLRGSAQTAENKKPRLIKWGIDINMYVQYVWVKGKYIVEELSRIDYL